MRFLRMARWSPYVVGALIGILSWLAFLTVDRPIGVSTALAKTSCMIAVNAISFGVRGGANGTVDATWFASGGKARRSILPFGVSGKVSSLTKLAGTMYCGNFASRN